jgi:hypothetical protein
MFSSIQSPNEDIFTIGNKNDEVILYNRINTNGNTRFIELIMSNKQDELFLNTIKIWLEGGADPTKTCFNSKMLGYNALHISGISLNN